MDRPAVELKGFGPAEEGMIETTIRALPSSEVLRKCRAVIVHGAALGSKAFSSQAMLNHVLEEELLHLGQKATGLASNVLSAS
jgi:hypothetical protein